MLETKCEEITRQKSHSYECKKQALAASHEAISNLEARLQEARTNTEKLKKLSISAYEDNKKWNEARKTARARIEQLFDGAIGPEDLTLSEVRLSIENLNFNVHDLQMDLFDADSLCYFLDDMSFKLPYALFLIDQLTACFALAEVLDSENKL